MSFILVLSTALATPALTDASLAAAAAAAEVSPSSARWLFPGVAAELPTGSPIDLTSVRTALGPAPIDANLVETTDRRKRLLVADLESTLIENEMLDDLAARLGIGPNIADITQRSMRGEVDFVTSLQERVALLTGAPVSLLAECAAQIRPMPGAKSLIATMAAKGARCVIATGGFGYFARPIAAELGCHAVYCNHLEMSADESRLTGRLSGAIFDRAAKRRALETEAHRLALPLSASLAVGDGANDLDMLAASGFGVAFRAKPVVTASTSLALAHSDLTGLLFLQGYSADEILRR